MIDFKDRDELPTNVVIVASVVIMVCAGLFMALAPKPLPQLTADQIRKQKNKANIAILDSTKKSKAASTIIAQKTWQGNPEEVLPLALQKVALMAQKHHLKVIGFHPQSLIYAPSITLIPCVVNVDGTFINVVAFEREIEAGNTNLAVNLMQFASGDQMSNKVSASIGIVAYQPVKESTPVLTSPEKPTQGSKTNA